MRHTVFAALALGACAPDLAAVEADPAESWIINGQPATERWTTSTVALMYRSGVVLDGPYCSGVLVEPDLVLTAAHCADFVRASDIAVYVGVTPSRTQDGRTYLVSDIEVHPSWNSRTLSNDLAALRLSRPVTQKVTYFPVLSSAQGFTSADVGADAMAIGYGVTESNDGGTRERAIVPILDVSFTPGVVYTDGATTSVCFGDSGGPLYVLRGGKVHVAGIHSFVGEDTCSSYSGHTRLDQQAGFLSGL